jgi:hypothetical protein
MPNWDETSSGKLRLKHFTSSLILYFALTKTVSSNTAYTFSQFMKFKKVFLLCIRCVSIMSQAEILYVKRLSPNAVLPVRGSKFSAGYDLASAEDTVIPAHGKAIVKTDLSIAIPENTYARIAPRSGLAAKNFIDVGMLILPKYHSLVIVDILRCWCGRL